MTRTIPRPDKTATSPPSPSRPLDRRTLYVLSRAETAECTCPEPCERDHANE
jgi:hypothetical protein